jgi:indolepyruvate ferredoxin oxidoreductase alpha subunit
MGGQLPREGELSHKIIDSAISSLVGFKLPLDNRKELRERTDSILFNRMLTLCAGCPHRSTIYALKNAVSKVRGNLKNIVVNGDIGCYGLAHAPPMSFEDTYFCMGASISVTQGMSHAGVDSIAWIGDGTFFHAGIPALINAVHNKHTIKVVVADNETIAMTGFQTNPQMGVTATGEPTKKIMIEDITKACGFEHIEVVDPYDLEATEQAFKRMLEFNGTSMVIARRICATQAIRAMRPNRPVPYIISQDVCIGCMQCLNTFGCPALIWDDNQMKARIDTTICMGCGSCGQVCPVGAMSRKE